MLLCAHSASVFREGDETVLDTEIEAGLISVGQLVRFLAQAHPSSRPQGRSVRRSGSIDCTVCVVRGGGSGFARSECRDVRRDG